MARSTSLIRIGFMAAALLAVVFVLMLPSKALAAQLEAGTVLDLDGPTVASALSTGPGKLTVQLTNGYTDKDVYVYEAALNKTFSKGLKILKSSSLKATFKGLSKGKKYYVRALARKTDSGTVYYTKWSSVASAKVALKYAKTKIVGAWKLVKSSLSSETSAIKYNRKYFPKLKYTITFKKNGTMVEKDYKGKKSKIKWVATSKKSGYFVYKGVKVGSIKVKGSKIKINNTSKIWTCARL